MIPCDADAAAATTRFGFVLLKTIWLNPSPAREWNLARVEPIVDRAVYTLACGLAGILAHDSVGSDGHRHSDRARVSACLLDRVFPLALEILGRSRGRLAHRAAADRPGFLRADCTRPAQPRRPMVANHNRTYSRVHIRRVGNRISVV